MAGSTQGIGFAETQKIAANMIASTLCNGGAEAFLGAQADLLRNMQTTMTEWLHRRREAIDDAYRLVERMRVSRDVNEIWKAQQEWAAGAIQRFAADVTACPAVFATAGEPAAQAVAATASDARQTVGEMARRVAEVMPRTAGKPPKVPAEPKTPAAEEMPAH